MDKVLLSTAYFPNLHYFFYLLNASSACIEKQENYQKQSFRNRMQILTANGVLDLVVPVRKDQNTLITQVEISYAAQWQRQHWRAICSAYRNSPYFEFFEDAFRPFYEEEFQYLFDYNAKQLEVIQKLLRLRLKISYTNQFEAIPLATDMRELVHPKQDFRQDAKAASVLLRSYYQTFSEKFPFIPNLSILDLIFNTGLDTVKHLSR